MYKKNYNSIHYWDALLDKNDLFEGSFNNLPLTKDSIFINSVIFSKGEILDSWAYYPNVKALLGFIKYVFLPSSFLNYFIDDDEEAIIVDVEEVDILVEIFNSIDNVRNKEKIEDIIKDYDKLEELWKLDDDECLLKLRIFINNFNKKWSNSSKDVFFYLNIFSTPMEIADYLINTYREVDMEDLFENDIEYTKEEFLNIVNNVYGNKFMEKKFIDILNNKLPVLI